MDKPTCLGYRKQKISYEEIKENNLLGFDEEGIIFAAQCEAQRKFEELPEPLDNS